MSDAGTPALNAPVIKTEADALRDRMKMAVVVARNAIDQGPLYPNVERPGVYERALRHVINTLEGTR